MVENFPDDLDGKGRIALDNMQLNGVIITGCTSEPENVKDTSKYVSVSSSNRDKCLQKNQHIDYISSHEFSEINAPCQYGPKKTHKKMSYLISNSRKKYPKLCSSASNMIKITPLISKKKKLGSYTTISTKNFQTLAQQPTPQDPDTLCQQVTELLQSILSNSTPNNFEEVTSTSKNKVLSTYRDKTEKVAFSNVPIYGQNIQQYFVIDCQSICESTGNYIKEKSPTIMQNSESDLRGMDLGRGEIEEDVPTIQKLPLQTQIFKSDEMQCNYKQAPDINSNSVKSMTPVQDKITLTTIETSAGLYNADLQGVGGVEITNLEEFRHTSSVNASKINSSNVENFDDNCVVPYSDSLTSKSQLCFQIIQQTENSNATNRVSRLSSGTTDKLDAPSIHECNSKKIEDAAVRHKSIAKSDIKFPSRRASQHCKSSTHGSTKIQQLLQNSMYLSSPELSCNLPELLLEYELANKKRWSKWFSCRKIVETLGCLRLLEEIIQVENIQGPYNDTLHHNTRIVALGRKLSQFSETSLASIIILENSVVVRHVVKDSHFWNSLGRAHMDIFLRHPKFLPVAQFHLERSLYAISQEFIYWNSISDPVALLRYAISLFWTPKTPQSLSHDFEDSSTRHKPSSNEFTRQQRSNLETSNDIFYSLFSKFPTFCSRDRIRLLFMHYQNLFRLRFYEEAASRLHEILEISHSNSQSNATQHPGPYTYEDYTLMMVHCLQNCGDYMQASTWFSAFLNANVISQETDEDNLHFWWDLANKCFQNEDYAIAAEYYAIAITYAKKSTVLASIRNSKGICYYAIGDIKNSLIEMQSARNVNRTIRPLISLKELNDSKYKTDFEALLHYPLGVILKDVYKTILDSAARVVQTTFRQRRASQLKLIETISSSSPPTRSAVLSADIKSISEEVNQTEHNNLEVELAMECTHEPKSNESAFRCIKSVSESRIPAQIFQNGSSDKLMSTKDRRQAVLEKLKSIYRKSLNCGSRANLDKLKTSSPALAAGGTDEIPRCHIITTESFQPNIQRRKSVFAYRQLGFLPKSVEWIQQWEKILNLGMGLYESFEDLCEAVSRIQVAFPSITHDAACCALIITLGNENATIEELHDSYFIEELKMICSVIKFDDLLLQHFPNVNIRATNIGNSDNSKYVGRMVSSKSCELPIESRVHFPSIEVQLATSPPQKALKNIKTFVLPELQTLHTVKSPLKTNKKGQDIDHKRNFTRVSAMIDKSYEENILSNASDNANDLIIQEEKLLVASDFRLVNSRVLRTETDIF